MIISASYRTDIPAFYGEWFIKRLDAGYCMVTNPYGGKPSRVSLQREDVDGIIFWTKNLGPFMEHLKIVHERAYPFIVQYTINGYPRTLEFSVVNAERSIQHMKTLSEVYGKYIAVWRYDTIVFTSETPLDFHRKNFERLTKALEGTTDEVVVSFAQIYKKTLRNMNWAAKKFGFQWEDPSDETKFNFVTELVHMAKARGMKLMVCSQSKYLAPGAEEARCIDAQRLSKISGKKIKAYIKGNRPDCGCYASRDIGTYDTCPHGCVYCYAVMNRELAQKHYHEHDPKGEFLYPRVQKTQEIEEVISAEQIALNCEVPQQLKLL